MTTQLTFNDLPQEVGRLALKIEKLYELLRAKEVAINQQENQDKPMLLEEACNFLKVSKPTLYRYCNNRKITSYKNHESGKIYFLKKDLVAYIEKGKRRTEAEIKDTIFSTK